MAWQVRFLEASYDFYQKILDLPPAAKFILYILDVKRCLNRTEIIRETLLPKRTVGSALILLTENGFVEKIKGKDLQKLERNYRRRIDYREVYYQIRSF